MLRALVKFIPLSSPSPHLPPLSPRSEPNQNLSIPLNPLIKFPIRLRRLLNPDHMANHPAGIGAARDYKVAQVAVVVLYVALACAEGESLCGWGLVGVVRWGEEGGRYLLEQLAEAESHFAAAGFCVRGAGIAGYAFGGGGEVSGFVPEAPNAM